MSSFDAPDHLQIDSTACVVLFLPERNKCFTEEIPGAYSSLLRGMHGGISFGRFVFYKKEYTVPEGSQGFTPCEDINARYKKPCRVEELPDVTEAILSQRGSTRKIYVVGINLGLHISVFLRHKLLLDPVPGSTVILQDLTDVIHGHNPITMAQRMACGGRELISLLEYTGVGYPKSESDAIRMWISKINPSLNYVNKI